MARITQKDEQSKEFVLDLKNMADERRKPYVSKWTDYAKIYRNQKSNQEKRRAKSDIGVPWPYIVVETYLPKASHFLLQYPYLLVMPEQAPFYDAASRTEKLVNRQLYLQRFPKTTIRGTKNAFIFGTEFFAVEPWTSRQGMAMPLLRNTRLLDTWLSPFITDLEDNEIEEPWMIHKSFMSPSRLMRMAARANTWQQKGEVGPDGDVVLGKPTMVEDVYQHITKIKDKDVNPFADQEWQELDAVIGLPTVTNTKWTKIVEILTYYSPSRIVSVANGDVCIRDTENPLGFIPFVCMRPLPAQFPEFYGMSLFEVSMDQFAELNETRSQLNDARVQSLTPMWETRDIRDKGKILESMPGRMIYSPDGTKKPVQRDWNILKAAAEQQQLIVGDIMDATNTHMQTRGAPVPRREPATTTLKQAEMGDIRANLYNVLLEMDYIERVGEMFVKLNRMHMIRPVNIPLNQDASRGAMVHPAALFGNFTYKAMGGAMRSRELERKQLMELMAIAFQNPAFIPLVAPKAANWLNRLVDLFPDIKNPEELIKEMDERDLIRNQQAIMLFEKLAGGGGNGGQRQITGGGEQFANNPMGDMIKNQTSPGR